MKRSLKETVARLLILVIGLTIAHFGVTLFLLAELGADPFNVLIQGLFQTIAKVTGWEFLTHGYTHMCICFLIIIILLIVDKTYIKMGTLICMLIGGPIIDIFTGMLQGTIHSGNPFILRVLTVMVGCIILSFGMTIVMESDAGTGPNDLVAIAISDKLHTPFGMTRTVTDISFIVAGWIMGGIFGIGTVICAFLVGNIAERFLPFQRNWISKVIQNIQE